MKYVRILTVTICSLLSNYSYSAAVQVDTYFLNIYEDWNWSPAEVEPTEKMARGRVIYFDRDGSFTEIWSYIIAFKGNYYLSEGDGQTRVFGKWHQKGNSIFVLREKYTSYGGFRFAKGAHPMCAPKTEEFTLSEDGTISLKKYIFSMSKLNNLNAEESRKPKDEYTFTCNDQ